MSDKKITQQVEHVTAVLGIDLMPMVGNTTTIPVNYKVQVKNFLSQITIDLPQTTSSALKVTASVTANANAATLTAAEFNVVANSSIGANGRDRYGLLVGNRIQNGNTTILGQIAAAVFTLDTGNSVTQAANTYGILISHETDVAYTAARVTPPRAYLGIKEDSGTNASAKTTFLLDLGAQAKLVSQDLANGNISVMFSKAADKVVTHTLRCQVNGMNVWLLASNTAPA